MKTAKLPETQLRGYVNTHMKGAWLMTWHEDREISPGVPDLHYVMLGGDHRVGWLELKAIDTEISYSRRVKVEPSQHQYLRRWCPLMPIHFLVRIKMDVFMVPGEMSKQLSAAVSLVDMKAISVLHFRLTDLGLLLPPFLREATKV